MMRLTVFAMLLCVAGADAQTVQVEVYAPPMRIVKIRAGLWQAVEEPCEVIVWWPGNADAIRIRRASPDIATIPPTYVRGIFRRAVDACEARGKFSDGSTFVIYLPREPVVLRGLTVVAVAIDCPTELVKKNGERWTGSVRFEDCIADPANARLRVARETTARGTLTLQKK